MTHPRQADKRTKLMLLKIIPPGSPIKLDQSTSLLTRDDSYSVECQQFRVKVLKFENRTEYYRWKVALPYDKQGVPPLPELYYDLTPDNGPFEVAKLSVYPTLGGTAVPLVICAGKVFVVNGSGTTIDKIELRSSFKGKKKVPTKKERSFEIGSRVLQALGDSSQLDQYRLILYNYRDMRRSVVKFKIPPHGYLACGSRLLDPESSKWKRVEKRILSQQIAIAKDADKRYHASIHLLRQEDDSRMHLRWLSSCDFAITHCNNPEVESFYAKVGEKIIRLEPNGHTFYYAGPLIPKYLNVLDSLLAWQAAGKLRVIKDCNDLFQTR